MRILGIDPGSRFAGYGCVEVRDRSIKLIDHGTLKLESLSGSSSMDKRLAALFLGIQKIIQECRPQILVVEQVFFAKNALSALKLGQARGVVLLSGALADIQIYECSATQVKSVVSGFGRAPKDQVAKMLQLILGPQTFSTLDASDAVALAVTHALTFKSNLAQSLEI